MRMIAAWAAWAACVAVVVWAPAQSRAQALGAPPAPAAQPVYSTTRVEGTDNVYIYRYMGHQSMFVVTPDGVIATDPQGFLLPEAAPTYLREIRKITKAPIRYVIYSHAHYDHIAGGQPFKDEGAVFVAHRRAKERLVRLKQPDVVIPDLVVDDRTVLTVGGTAIELSYVGRTHSDNMLVMRLPKEKILFAVDFIPVGLAPPKAICLSFFCVGNMSDYYPIEYEEGLRKVLDMDWDRMIPGHPSVPAYATKQDVRNLLNLMTDVAAETKKASAAGQCNESGQKALSAAKQPWDRYPWATPDKVASAIWRYCLYWGQGY